MSIAIAIKKIRRNWNDFGIGGAFTKGVQYLLKSVYVDRIYRIYRRDLFAGQFPEPTSEGLVFKVIGTGDSQAIRQIENMEEWLQGQLPEIMSRGLCVAVFDGPTVVGFNLVAFQQVYVSLLNMRKRLRADQAWSEQITVDKAYRKQGLASALRYRVFSELQKRGFRSLYGGALASNIPSLKSAQKVGFRFIADVRYQKLLNRERRIYRRVRNVGN